MPKVVNHDERRVHLARAALRVIGHRGLAATTTRQVAAESGWSTGVLKHYFTNKDDLLVEARRELERATLERFDRSEQDRDRSPSDPRGFRRSPPRGPTETKVWIAFVSRASTDTRTAGSMHRAIDLSANRWAGLVRRGQQDGSINGDIDAHATALELHALLNGLRTNAIFHPTASNGDGGSVRLTLLDALLAPHPEDPRG